MPINQPKVSVIIPVYNAECTLSRCLDSFLAQTLTGWELIIVDDGSTDSSGQICDDYKKKCESVTNCGGIIQVIHRQNGGVSAARQTGLESAQGEYVIHADPDDWAESTMLEELYEKACKDNADMVICDFIAEVGGQNIYRTQKPTSLNHEDVLNDMFGVNVHGSCCNKLVRRDCIAHCNAHFPKGINYCEDVCFNVQLLKHNIKVSYLAKAFYHYVQLTFSITNHYTRKTLSVQKKYINFLTSQMPAESLPVVKSKLLVKKLAFRNSVLTKKEFQLLYPEIQQTDDRRFLPRWMYNAAFKGNSIIASVLLFFYNKIS